MKILAISLVLSVSALLADTPAAPLVPINESGFQKLVDSHKGKVVLYDFWATWCAPCRAEMPQLLDLEQKLRSRGVEIVTISADDREHRAAAEKFIQMFRVQGTRYIRQADNDDDDRFTNPSIQSGAALCRRSFSTTAPATGSGPSSGKPRCPPSKPPFANCSSRLPAFSQLPIDMRLAA